MFSLERRSIGARTAGVCQEPRRPAPRESPRPAPTAAVRAHSPARGGWQWSSVSSAVYAECPRGFPHGVDRCAPHARTARRFVLCHCLAGEAGPAASRHKHHTTSVVFSASAARGRAGSKSKKHEPVVVIATRPFASVGASQLALAVNPARAAQSAMSSSVQARTQTSIPTCSA